MCGIAGILKLDRTTAAPAEVLERMLQSIYHRGPDEDGRLFDEELAMGMRRLSIIDLADGQQPIFDESGRYAVVFNGEIYNYRELRQELIGRGHTLKTHSDTEVIVHLYEEQGPDCLEQLRGMFGIAVWDKRERKLFIARDRMGIKPLYYAIKNNSLIFGSEIKALLVHPDVDAALDLRGLSNYLSLKYIPSPGTLFEEIQSIPPGHYLIAQNGRIEIKRYWNISYAKPKQPKSEAEYIDEATELIRESVKLRLRSDVPFGAFLSGGVDSSTIVAFMAEQMSEPVRTFSVGFGEGDELPYAKMVADRFGCDHHTLNITANDFIEHAETVLWHMDQPIADQATVATLMVAKLARQHVKMVLTGEGGDELFAGYARYAGERFSPYTRWLPNWAGRIIRSGARRLPGMRRGKLALHALTTGNEAQRFANWFPMFNDETKRQVLSERMSDYREGAADIFAHHLGECDAREPLDRMLYVDSKLWLPDFLLLRGDKLTMANSLEARIPLLDHKLVEFAARLPTKYKLHRGDRKYLLKRVAERMLPSEIIHRKKQGFPIPIDRWLRNEARPLMRDMLSQESLQHRSLFNPQFVETLMQQHESGFADNTTELWGLVSLEIWMRRMIDEAAGA
ncbi:MAG: asparagine synthase (glutamine-hydrolyzing) [Pirellulaceae bacterium]